MTADSDRTELLRAALAAVHGVGVHELHGAACGVLAGGGGQGDLIGLIGEEALTDQDCVARLWRICAAQAFDSDMIFAPLLTTVEEASAADNSALAERVDALAQWVGSFLAGFLRLQRRADLGAETTEIVQDLAAIAGADTVLDDNDDNEADYVELLEFVRVAALLLFAEISGDETRAGKIQ